MSLTVKHYYALLGISLSSLILSLVFLVTHFRHDTKRDLVYVDNIRLFNEFQMFRDLIGNNTTIDTHKKGLDSLYSLYSVERELNNVDKAAQIEKEIRDRDHDLKTLRDNHSRLVGQKVWNKLNEYIQEYADLQGFTIVFGTQGNGNIMFAGEGMDITTAVLDYANQKYQETE